MAIHLDQRPLTPAERDSLAGSVARIVLVSLPGVVFRYVLVFALLTGLVMAAAAIADGIVRKTAPGVSVMQWQPPSWAVPLLVVAIWGPVVLVPVHFATRSLRRAVRRQRARTRDRVGGHARVARVDAPRFVGLLSKHGQQRWLFDVSPTHSLLLDGERARHDHALFGLPEPDPDGEAEDEIEDDDVPREDAPAPAPFPSVRFDLHWLPHSGRLLRIDVQGNAIAPLRVYFEDEVPAAGLLATGNDGEREAMLLERGLDAVLASVRVAR